jgi:dienelactone hydrolase
VRALPAPEPVEVPGPGPRLAAWLWPAPPEAPAVLVAHGWGSRKENHADVAEACAAAGMAAMAVDLRGHGASGGAPGPGLLDDVLAGLDALAARGHRRLGLRGSSMGGFLALHAAARHPLARAVVAICPARPEGLARIMEADWPLALPTEEAVARDDGVARMYWHATGDDRVPWGATLALAGITPHPMRLRVVLGGGHRTLQHDGRALAAGVAFLAGHLR